MPTAKPSPAVLWREVSKSYPDGHVALDRVSLEVAGGEVLAILGTSGSGKTTLLKMVNRLIEPTSGEVLVRGIPASHGIRSRCGGRWDTSSRTWG